MPANLLSTVVEATPSGLAWVLGLCVISLFVVVVVALLRARREDVPRVFASFAGSFGFRTSGAERTTPAAATLARSGDDATTIQ